MNGTLCVSVVSGFLSFFICCSSSVSDEPVDASDMIRDNSRSSSSSFCGCSVVVGMICCPVGFVIVGINGVCDDVGCVIDGINGSGGCSGLPVVVVRVGSLSGSICPSVDIVGVLIIGISDGGL